MDFRMARLVCALAMSCAIAGCEEFDTTPLPVEHGTLGEEIYQVFCERMAAEANPDDTTGARWKPVCEGRAPLPDDSPPRLVALEANRGRLVDAIDRTIPEELTDELGNFLGELLPFFDPPAERLPNQTRRLADFLHRLSNDDEAIAALERIGNRQGYRPLRLALGVTRPVLAYPDFDRFSELALYTILEGSAREEFDELQRALALEMATLEPPEAPAPGERTTLELMRELMFTEDDLFAVGDTRYVLVRDTRGLALPAGGVVSDPFVDTDLDGLADVDALGRFVAGDGTALLIPGPFRTLGESGIPRDSGGRALRTDGTRYYEYIDASRTMLAGTTAELSPWFDPDAPTLLQMSRGLPLLMGGEVASQEAYGSHTLDYTSFETSQGSMFDVIHALGELMYRPETDDALAITEILLRDYESETAGVMRAARFTANQGDLYPAAQLTSPSNFWDDLIDLVIRIVHRPGMLEAVMRSLSDPRSAQIGDVYAELMRNRDRVTYDPVAPNGDPIGFPLDQPVNHAQPDTFDNESLFQRTLALIDGLNGVRVCNREGATMRLTIDVPGFGERSFTDPRTFGACELIDIPNVAEAYALAILGRYTLEIQDTFTAFLIDAGDFFGLPIDEILQLSARIDGLTRTPTPQAFNRLVFWGLADSSGVRSCTPNPDGTAGDCNADFAGRIFEPIRDRHGNLVIERYHGTIFAWEMPGFYESLTPLAEVLHTPGWQFDDSGRYLFGELLSTLHVHWASRNSTETCGAPACALGDSNFSYQSNVRSYEPLIADGFDQGELVRRVHALQLALEQIELRPGEDGIATLAAATEDIVDPDRNAGIADRRGNTTTTVNDGSRVVPMSPLYLLLDALAAMDRDLEVDPDRRAEWRAARHNIAEQFLHTTPLGEGFLMENQRARAILLTVIPFMRARMDEHRAAGDLFEWSTTLHERMEDTMREPLVSALIRFMDAVNEDPESRAALAALMGYLMDVASENDAFASTLYAAADAMFILEDEGNVLPLIHALSDAMAPNVREVIASGGALDIESSAVRDSLALMQDIGEVDDDRVLRRLLQNAVALPAEGEEITPLEIIVDVLAEVNRASPNEGGTLRQDDYRSVIGHVTGFIEDEDHGLERLNAVVQNRQCFPEHGRACGESGATMDSAGLCYPGARCICADNGGTLTWECAR